MKILATQPLHLGQLKQLTRSQARSGWPPGSESSPGARNAGFNELDQRRRLQLSFGNNERLPEVNDTPERPAADTRMVYLGSQQSSMHSFHHERKGLSARPDHTPHDDGTVTCPPACTSRLERVSS